MELYLGILGIHRNIVLYEPIGSHINKITELRISNIVVLYVEVNPIPNYSLIMADEESTNIQEIIRYTTNGGDWN